MHLKMEKWHSEWVTDESLNNEPHNSVDVTHFRTLYNSVDDINHSPNVSRDDSTESYGDDQPEKNDTVLKPTFKSVLQAKKRLQAFSAVKQLKKSNSREEKPDEYEKSDKTSPKKAKKALYPDDKAKAVIKEIEEIKRMEARRVHDGRTHEDVLSPDVIMPPAIKSISLKEVIRARSRSLSSEREHFKRREIKCRNYRRKSVSPEDYNRRKSPVKKLTYPKNWTEYKEQNLSLVKDDELKSKLFPKHKKYDQYELVTKLINYDTPSPFIEAFKCSTVEDNIEIIPASFMRVTRAKPPLAYSINFRKNKEGFISRKQLFNIIPRERRDFIEKLFNMPPRSQPSAKSIQSRQWYSKTWRKISDAECKVLENSVGLSFLQNYSDEEEDNETEEIVICSSTKDNNLKNNTSLEKNLGLKSCDKDQLQIKTKLQKEKVGKDIVAEKPEKSKSQIDKVEKSRSQIEKIGNESHLKKSEKLKNQEEKSSKTDHQLEKAKQQVEEKSPTVCSLKKVDRNIVQGVHQGEEKGKLDDFPPKKKPEELKRWHKDELNETRRAIKELEEELQRRKAIKMEEESKEAKKTKKKKQKKEKKKQELSDSEEEEESITKTKKKKKNKTKKKVNAEEDSLSSDDEKRKKKKTKKDKYKKEKFRKKKDKFKKEEEKEIKSKKKEEVVENDNLKDESKKKKKKPSSDDTNSSQDRSKSVEVTKNKKNKKRDMSVETDTESDKEIEVSELENRKHFKQNEEKKDSNENSGNKRSKKNRWDDFDIESFAHENEKYEKTKSDKSIGLNEINSMDEFKKAESKEDNKKTAQKIEGANKEKPSKYEKEPKHHEDENKKKREKECHKPEESKLSKVESEKAHDNVKFKGDLDEMRVKDVEEAVKSKKHDEYFDKKHANKEKPKVDVDKTKVDEKVEEKNKHVDNKVIRDRKISGKPEKSDNQRKHDDFRDRYRDRDEKLERQQKEKRYDVRHEKLENIKVKEEPDWENLRSKRRRHRNSDSKNSNKDISEELRLSEELEDIPLKKDELKPDKNTARSNNKKSQGGKRSEFGTPDTDEYRENWEKDTFPIWESEDDVLPKPKEKLNNSWESDEETFERGNRIVESSRPFRDTFDLEIPLNIKPFKRRDVIDPDIELQLLKRESITLSEERRRLEIEKQRVKELELKVIRETENKALEDQFQSKRRRSTEEKMSRTYEREKEGRWDKRVTQPKKSTKVDVFDPAQVKKENSDEDCIIVNISSPTPTNNSAAALENEYEEFLKAVTSSATPKRKTEQKKSKKVETISSSSSFSSLSDIDSRITENTHIKKKLKNDNDVEEKVTGHKNLVPKLDETTRIDSPVNPIITILPKDIPLIPMPAPIEVKPVPVPSPQIDIEKIPKPLINLNLSANITLDIASKLVPPTLDSPNRKSMEFIDSPKSNFDTTPKSVVPNVAPSPTVKSAEFTNSPIAIPIITQSPLVQRLEEKKPSTKPEALINFASPLTDASLDSVLFDEASAMKESQRLNKPFVFTSMVIQSKKLLLDNSSLNLGDSDDEAKSSATSMKSLEEIKKECSIDVTKVVTAKEEKQVHFDKPKEKEAGSQVKGERSSTTEKKDRPRSPRPRSPANKKHDSKRHSKEKVVKRDVSPRRTSYGKRDPSPRRRPREPSPKRRRSSPRRHTSPRRRSPVRRRSSPAKRKYSPRRSPSPRYRRRSISPRRRSPRRSPSPKLHGSSPKRLRSKSPDRPKSTLPSYKPSEAPPMQSNRPPSPATITSPLDGLKRSVADSTISDDLLPQPSANLEDYAESPVSRFYDRASKLADSPKRVPLDDRINIVLGLQKEEPKPIPTTFSSYNYHHSQYSQQYIQLPKPENDMTHAMPSPIAKIPVPVQQPKSNFVQVGNMVRIVPTENIPIVSPPIKPPPKNIVIPLPVTPYSEKAPVVPKVEKSHIVQVGNMLQIVPADLSPEPPLPPEPKIELEEAPPDTSAVIQEKQSAEAAMKLKIAERRAEREQRREERERRRKDKEKRRKEKEKQRQIKLKQRTENMIKKALQLEVEGGGEEDDEIFMNEKPTQWPPLPVVVSNISKEVGKSILIRRGNINDSLRDKRKIVQFADGVRPGEGTSPSGGEELSSPPPASKKLPKEKRYKKTKLQKKNQKKKVKVKIIKKREVEESDEEDNLPPPSPPPGSPPPHLFPPRVKTHTINNVHPYVPNVVSLQTTHNQQLYRPQLNIIMHHHPPPPPHHHGPPPPPPGPPHHHHGPPPPSGPPHFPHGPPPPPGPPHHHGPPPPHGLPGHHVPPSPYHH